MQPSTDIRIVKVGEPAPKSRVLNEFGQEVELSSFWSGAANGAVVIFLRNFGCLFCREQAKRLRDANDAFRSRDINLVAVGVGTPQDAAEFSAWMKLPYPVLGQPDTSIHAAWGLGRSTAGNMLNPSLVRAGFRALRSGSIQGKATGDSRQLPGTFIVDRQGIIRWARPATHPGDNPPMDELLSAIDRVRANE